MHKVKTHPIRFTVGGDLINYKGKVITPTAALQTIKILLNSTVSTPDAKVLTATPGLFCHTTRPVTFFLVVDNFAIKYVDSVNAKHLFATLRSLYNITTDWTASMYCGITLK